MIWYLVGLYGVQLYYMISANRGLVPSWSSTMMIPQTVFYSVILLYFI
jgi:hypothetical protein